MTVNAGNIDRIVRALVGAILLYLAFFSGAAAFEGGLVKYGTALLGLVMVAVAAVGICPIYSIFGVKTCRTR